MEKSFPLPPPKSRDTFVEGIASDIVGTYEPKGGAYGFLRSKRGVYLKFKYPGTRSTEPHGINDAGAVVGIYRSKDGFTTHGFLRHPDGTFQKVVAHGSTWPVAINAGGVIVGSDAHEGVFVQAVDGTNTTIKIADAIDTEPVGISAKGTVVGYYLDKNSVEHGFVWTQANGAVLFDVPGATATIPSGINDQDVIAGKCVVQDGDIAAGFIRTP